MKKQTTRYVVVPERWDMIYDNEREALEAAKKSVHENGNGRMVAKVMCVVREEMHIETVVLK